MYIFIFIFLAYKLFTLKKYWKTNKKGILNFIASGILIFLIAFNILWGLNYYRIPLHEKLKIENQYSEDELVKVTHLLTDRINTIHSKYAKNINDRIETTANTNQIYANAAVGYQVLAEKDDTFLYKNPTVKSSLYSTVLTYMGFSGYLNPFTNEAHVNSLMPKNNMMVTASHEIAHQIGIGPESEANFVGYLAAKNNTQPYFDYAATSFALRYCLVRYPFKDKTDFENYVKKINPGVLADWQHTRDFWQKHETFIDAIFKFIYDKFLKLNQQEFGIEGYSKFLDLLIQYELNLEENK